MLTTAGNYIGGGWVNPDGDGLWRRFRFGHPYHDHDGGRYLYK
jgi:hypothetical protein